MDLHHLELFALADDRTRALEHLVPGTEDSYFHRCLVAEQAGDFAEVSRTLGTWIDRHGVTARVEEIRNRLALLRYEQDPTGTLEHLRTTLDLRFDHAAPPAEGQEARYPTALDPAVIARAAVLRAGLARSQASDLSGFTDAALPWLIREPMSVERLRHLLGRLLRPDLPGLVERVAAELHDPRSGGFGSLPIHGRLLLEQLDALVAQRPELRESEAFVHAYLVRLAPGPDVDWERDPDAHEAYLARLDAFVATLPAAFGALRAHVLYHRLDLDRRRGIYDRERLVEYLALPRRVPYAEPAWLRRFDTPHARPFRIDQDFRPLTGHPVVRSDEALVRDHLGHHLRQTDDPTPFGPYLRASFLKEVFAAARLMDGDPDVERWTSMLGDPAAFATLKDRVLLHFAPTNRQYFRSDDEVRLEVDIKNVSTLTIKVFEINTLAYFLARGREVDTSIDLDGLVASEQQVHELTEPPLRCVRRSFALPSLAGPGVYVVELLGGGISSRALVCKGRLRFLERVGVAGHVFTVLDEDDRIVPDPTLWLGGREYEADASGAITVPFTTRPGPKTILLRHGDQTAVETFEHQAERYRLEADFYVDRESLLRGGEATVLVRPRLRVGDAPASSALLEEPTLVIRSTDRDGVESTTEVHDFTLHDDRESTHAFPVPDRLVRLEFRLRGEVEVLSEGKTLDLEAEHVVSLNGIDREDAVEDLHLARTCTGTVIYLYGRTGEPRPDTAVRLRLQHRDLKPTLDVMLQTDARGRVTLGHLRDVLAVQATAPSGRPRRWTLPRDRATRPSAIHAREGEMIRVPLAEHEPLGAQGVRDALGVEVTAEPRLVRGEVSLLETRGEAFVHDRFEALRHRDAYLEIEGLAAGSYDLWLAREQVRVAIRVVPAQERGRWLVGECRHLERSDPPVQICEAVEREGALEIRVGHATLATRVHVFATRLVPDGAGLDAPAPRLRAVHPVRRASHYVSGRDIGDEYRYILERRHAEPLPGDMLPRPGLLLQPWAMSRTQTATQTATVGSAYGGSPQARAASAAPPPPPRPAPRAIDEAGWSNLDFLAHPAGVALNLRPDARGMVSVPRAVVEHANEVRVVAVAHHGVACRDLLRPEVDASHRDLRLVQGLDPGTPFTQQRRITLRTEGQPLRIDHVATARVEPYDTLERVFRLLVALSGDPTLQQFGFVLRWPALSEADKRARYSEYACHELNLLLSRKDPEFFTRVVVPHLRTKQRKTFLDHYLLGDDLSEYQRPWAFGRLNIMERILLASRGDDPGAGQRHVADLDDLRPPDVERDNRLFRAALGSKALETPPPTSGGAPPGEAVMYTMLGQAGPMPGAPPAPRAPGAAPAAPRKARMRSGPAGFARSGGPPPAPAAAAPMDAEAEQEAMHFGLGEGGGGAGDDDGARDMAARRKQPRLFRAPETTQEWAENDYYHRPIEQQGPALITVNPFWRDFAAHRPPGPFLSPHIAHASGSFAEMMGALAVLDLPWEAQAPQSTREGEALVITGGSPAIVFHEQIEPAQPDPEPPPILVSQHYLRPDDRHRYEGGEAHDKYVTGELLVGVVYACKVVLTNPTSAPYTLELLLQIPVGSLPVADGFYTRGQPVELPPQGTCAVEYAFYFPAPGTFDHFPVHVARRGRLVAAAEARPLVVVREPSRVDHDAWAWVSHHGTDDQVLAWLDAHNIERLRREPGEDGLERIVWRLKDRDFYDRCLARLAGRHAYDHGLWSYAIHHDDAPNITEFLLHEDRLLDRCGTWLRSPLVEIDPVARHRYQHLEYAPLVNARAHRLGARLRILNERLAAQYTRLLDVLRYRPALDDEDRLAVTYYLLLQDRWHEGLRMFDRIDRERVAATMQYDYVQVHALMLREQLPAARRLAERYRDYPVDRWRTRFEAALAQLDELDGAAPQVTDPEDRDQQQAALADAEPHLELTVEDGTVTVGYRNLATVRVSYYLMDIELLFSRQPFVQQQSERFSFIRPGRSDALALPPDRDTLSFPLPEQFHGTNVVVELLARGQRRQQPYFAHALSVQLGSGQGQVRVTRRGTGEPLPRTYVKVYARMQGGAVEFYKDGYTDLRGRFDYASLSTRALDQVERFAMLVLSPAHGAVIREVDPPGR